MSNGKGDRPRPILNQEAYDRSWDRIFGKAKKGEGMESNAQGDMRPSCESQGEELPLKERCFRVREKIEEIKKHTASLTGSDFFLVPGELGQHAEIRDNIKLAYRHLEDAKMRIGKVIQAIDGGESCYPR